MPAIFDRIQGRLMAVLGALVVGSLVIWWLGSTTLNTFAADVANRVSEVQQSSGLGARLVTTVTDQLAAGEHYLLRRDSASAVDFRQLGLEAHALNRRYRRLPGLTAADQSRLQSIETLHSQLEVQYSLAHAQRDLGENAAAAARVEAAQPQVQKLRELVRNQEAAESRRMVATVAAVQRAAAQRQPIMLGVLIVVVALGLLLALGTTRAINRPLRRLVVVANRFGAGDLTGRVGNGRMPGELRDLAAAFGLMADRLRLIVSETVGTSDQIAGSASELSAISEQVAASSGQVSSAMAGITAGAEQQASGLHAVREAMSHIRARADVVTDTASDVRRIGAMIEQTAAARRAEVGNAVNVLQEVREAVQAAGEQVTFLQSSSDTIEQFVATIQGIARQTNLLALNAAIEAARAGDQGRGFAVVAEEVRKLADDSAEAAHRVESTVADVRAQIDAVAARMREGTTKVGAVAEVSRGMDAAFEEIIGAIAGVQNAAERVAESATENREGVSAVERALGRVGETAESHAASAQQVSAAAEEQSAATEELSAASAELLQAAERLKELVSEFRV